VSTRAITRELVGVVEVVLIVLVVLIVPGFRSPEGRSRWVMALGLYITIPFAFSPPASRCYRQL
jgi:hypothetical protein